MKTILCGINAKFIHTNLAIRQIKGYVEANSNYEISLLEFTINNYINEIFEEIYINKPDVIGFSCYLWNIELVQKLIVLLKKLLPDIIIILGGPEVSYSPIKILKENPCDFIICGEGEGAFCELLSEIASTKKYEMVKGIAYKSIVGEIIQNDKSEFLDMSLLPFPYTDFHEIENKICYYEASRGCPFKCAYCISSVENGVRFSPLEKVLSELKIFLDENVRQVKFVDRTFNCNNAFAMSIIKFLIDNDNGVTNFHFEMAAELLTDEIIALLSLARRGLFQLEIGVQSTNLETLNAISRKSDFCWLSQCVKKLLVPQNVHLHLDLIAGLPLENFESFKKSFDDVHSLSPHQLQLGFLKILKGSRMESLCDEFEILHSPFPPFEFLKTHCLSFDEVIVLKSIEEMVEIYYNTNRYCHAVEFLRGYCESYFDLYLRLAEYKNKKGIGSLVHNKQFSYAFLIDFVADNFSEYVAQAFNSVLKLDFLLHEKPRSLPEWAKRVDNQISKDEIYDFIVKKDDSFISELLPEYSDCQRKQLLKLVHVEMFSINPFTLEKSETTLLFNYRSRDLWNNAMAIQIELGLA